MSLGANVVTPLQNENDITLPTIQFISLGFEGNILDKLLVSTVILKYESAAPPGMRSRGKTVAAQGGAKSPDAGEFSKNLKKRVKKIEKALF